MIFKGAPARVPAAERHLITADDAALPALRHALAQPTLPRIRQRLRAALEAIAQADALRGPLITLQLKKATLQTVFTKLCIPAGIGPDLYPMGASLTPPPPYFQHTFLTINVQRQPFWQVMRRIAKVTGVSPTADGFTGPELHIGGQPPMVPGIFGARMPVDIQGAFVIAPQWPWADPQAPLMQRRPVGPEVHHATMHVLIRRVWRLTLIPGSTRTRKKLLLLVNVLWCPAGNRLIEFGPLQITQAVDDTGKSLLLPARPDTPRRANWNSGWSASGQMIVFNCPEWLKHPSPHAKMLSRLRGRFPVRLCFDRRQYQLKNLSSGNARFYWRGLKVQFGRPILQSPAPGQTDLQRWRVRVLIDSGVASQRQRWLAGHLAQQFEEMSAVKFYSASGTYLGTNQPGGYYRADWKGSYDYEISGGKPVRAHVTLYRQTNVKLTVPFVLKNVPLPR
ncbi:MAG: hypothetical protein HKL95_09215 [Phycisphaerae bacterium]|nr:hypothetical protein [Phycisphaerae bacterium]